MSMQPRGDLTTRTLAMPADANPSGDIFGGWVLSQMDIAGGIHAGQRAQRRVATVAIEAMHFIKPVHVGDVLCVYAAVDRVGRTRDRGSKKPWPICASSPRRRPSPRSKRLKYCGGVSRTEWRPCAIKAEVPEVCRRLKGKGGANRIRLLNEKSNRGTRWIRI